MSEYIRYSLHFWYFPHQIRQLLLRLRNKVDFIRWFSVLYSWVHCSAFVIPWHSLYIQSDHLQLKLVGV